MSDSRERAPVRFCPGCGERAAVGAHYCPACGAPLQGRAAAQDSVAQTPAPRAAGLAILVGFLAVGLTLWVTILQPDGPRERRPLAPKTPAPTAAGTMPPEHPPLALPDEVKRFIASLEAQARETPDDLAVLRNLAQVQYRAAQIDRTYLAGAERSFRRLLELAPADPTALRGLGNVHFDRDQYDEAVKLYSAYLEQRPDDVNVRTDIGTMRLYGGQLEEAIAEYRKALAVDPDFYQAHFNLGVAYARRNDADKASASLGEAKRLAPDDATRAQIDRVLAQFGSDSAGPGGSFQERVSTSLRRHEIAGPKVAGFEWSSELEGRALLDEFPMDKMPEFVRTKFLDRLERDLQDAKRAVEKTGTARLELVDRASGQVMATVTAE